ncbi:MAG: class I SAM-dependent methyltransferase [Bacillota bacterium]
MTIPRSTRALLQFCPVSSQPALDIASYQGAVARSLGCGYAHDHWAACELARAAGVTPLYHTDQLPAGSYATIFLDARELDPALAAGFVAQAAGLLQPGGTLYTTTRREDLAPWFGEIEEQNEALVARRPLAGQAEFEVLHYSVTVGEHTLPVRSEPGVFSPRGLDPGTREMLNLIEAQPGQRFLDLGCGVGVVSLVATRVWGCEVTAVDVSARALRLTRLNVPEAEVIPSDGFLALAGRQFDVIASNPPYHTDFAIAKGFIEGAHQHLSPDGWLYLVVKRADWYVQKVRTVFGGCRVVERDGYTILSAQKRVARPKARPAEPKTTKKHARRVAASKRKGQP